MKMSRTNSFSRPLENLLNGSRIWERSCRLCYQKTWGRSPGIDCPITHLRLANRGDGHQRYRYIIRNPSTEGMNHRKGIKLLWKLTQQTGGIPCSAGHGQKPVTSIRDARWLRRSKHTSACWWTNVIAFVTWLNGDTYFTRRDLSAEDGRRSKVTAKKYVEMCSW